MFGLGLGPFRIIWPDFRKLGQIIPNGPNPNPNFRGEPKRYFYKK